MSRKIEILLVEDNPADVRLTREAFREGRIDNRLHVVGDGVAAMQFLRRESPYEDAPQPDLVLLDLNLPKKDGREVLADLKADETLRAIPVVVLTTSDDQADVLRSYRLHANCYLVKPIEYERFLDVIHSINNFWLSVVKLPPKKRTVL